MTLKENLQRKIEKNSVKSIMTWTDKKGDHTEEVIMKRSNTPLVGDWQRIYPPINEDGSWNWINTIFGGKKNLIKLIMVLGIMAMILFAFNEVFNGIEAFRSTPCVQSCIEMAKNQLPKLTLP